MRANGKIPPEVHPILLGLSIVMHRNEDLINISASHPDMAEKHIFYEYRIKNPPDLSHLLPPQTERWWEHIAPVLPPAAPHSPPAAPYSPPVAPHSPPAAPHSPLAAHCPLSAAPHSPPASRCFLLAAPRSPPAASHSPPAGASFFPHAPGPTECDSDAHMEDEAMSEEEDELDDDSDTQQLAPPKRPKVSDRRLNFCFF